MSVVLAAVAAAAAASGPAIGADIFYSTDADETDVVKAGVNFDLRYAGPDERLGVRIERAHFAPNGQHGRTMDRAYVRAADRLGGWKWNATVGTDGHTVLGSAAIHDESRFRKELFVEREILETPQGLSRGLYYTFAGGAVDLPVDDRNVVTLVAGVQPFSGGNVRTHLRGTYVHVVKSQWGLSAQVRARYFHSSDPNQFDYFSPRWYAEVLPVVQLRRFVGGWQLLGAVGYGAQRDSTSKWRSSRLLNARVTSPRFRRDWAISAALLVTNTPVSAGYTYGYTQFNVGVTKAF